MTLVDHWDVEELKFRILSGTKTVNNEKLGCPCWIWQCSNSGKGDGAGRGYGRISYRGVNRATHRIAFVLWNGPISGKKQVDHICNNRLCCNPAHLKLVTSKQNHRLRVKRSKEKVFENV